MYLPIQVGPLSINVPIKAPAMARDVGTDLQFVSASALPSTYTYPKPGYPFPNGLPLRK